MARTARALQNEMLDALVWRVTGGGSPAVDATFELNPGLAELGPLLAEGTVVNLPDIIASVPTIDLVQLWN